MMLPRRTRIALATYEQLPGLTADDELVVPHLARLGIDAEAAAWSDATVRWTAYDAVVLRSCWDYHLDLEAFLRWVGEIGDAGVPLLNPPEVVRWNASKTYLRDLAERGVDVVPTRWVEQGSETTLALAMAGAGWDDVVIKGAVSASAHETWRVEANGAAAHEPVFRSLSARGPVLVQRFMESIQRDGEWSFLFFGGEFSHAAIKRPKDGDFRVQANFGGTYTRAEPDAALRAQAARALAAAPAACVYARVDGCVEDGRLRLMELELLEPDVFLRLDERAPARFAGAIADALRLD